METAPLFLGAGKADCDPDLDRGFSGHDLHCCAADLQVCGVHATLTARAAY
jgi:hypothetical protein